MTLPNLAGLRLGDSTVEQPAAGLGLTQGRRGKACAYMAVDATGVGQQGDGGARSEGRMATVAMAYNPVPEARDRRLRPAGPAARRPASCCDGRRRRWGWSGPTDGSPDRRRAGAGLYPGDDAAREGWLNGWCHRLKHEGGLAFLEDLGGLEVRGGEGGEGGGGTVLHQPGAPDGLSVVPGRGLDDQGGAGGDGVQDGDRPADEGGGDAMG